MKELWCVYDKKGGDPTNFSDREEALKYARAWIKRALGKNSDIREIDRSSGCVQDNRIGGDIQFYVGPFPLLSVVGFNLFDKASKAPKRKDYPRPSGR